MRRVPKYIKLTVVLILLCALILPTYANVTPEEDTNVKGSITLIHKDIVDDTIITDAEVIENLDIKAHEITPKVIEGYTLTGKDKLTITLTQDSKDKEITIYYCKNDDSRTIGTVTETFIDTKGNKIAEQKVLENTNIYTYKSNPVDIANYTFSSYLYSMDKNAKTGHMKYSYIKKEEPTATGKIIVECYNTSNEKIHSSEQDSLELGEHVVKAPILEDYAVVGEKEIIVNLTPENLTQTVKFKYEPSKAEVKGTITIKAVEDSTNEILYEDIKENCRINIEFTVNSPEVKGYSVIGDKQQSVVLTETEKNKEVVFKYKKNPTGSITVKYIDFASGGNIIEPVVMSDLEYNIYTIKAKQIKGYELRDKREAKVTVNDKTPNPTVTFHYAKETPKGTVFIKYLDADGNELAKSETIRKEFGKYTFEAKPIQGYSITGEYTTEVTLSPDMPTATLIFTYRKDDTVNPNPEPPTTGDGEVVINYVDEAGITIAEPEVYTDLRYGEYTFKARTIKGYKIIGDNKTAFTLDEENNNVNVTFKYRQVKAVKGTVNVMYLDKETNAIVKATERYNNLAFGKYTYKYKEIDGYKLVSDESISVEISSGKISADVIFRYEKLTDSSAPVKKPGKVTLRYLDAETGKEIKKEIQVGNLALKEYVYSGYSIDGYEIVGEKEVGVSLTNDTPDTIVTFKYKKLADSADKKENNTTADMTSDNKDIVNLSATVSDKEVNTTSITLLDKIVKYAPIVFGVVIVGCIIAVGIVSFKNRK